jgi:hypothetical protein
MGAKSRTGWLYAAAGLVWTVNVPWDPWVNQLLVAGRPLPLAARLAALAADSLWAVGLLLAVTLPLLLLPDGQLGSRRWRVVAAAGPLLLAPLGELGLLPSDTFALPMLLSVPVAIAVAVLRYRLWDLDRLVSRTVTYALVTALLVLPYLLVVPTASKLVEGAGSLAVAAATLTTAALFQPLRRRVQQLVDRRRYDAARTVERFATRLRDQVDLDALHAELLAVVDHTMQPAAAALWLRPSPAVPSPAGGRTERQ